MMSHIGIENITEIILYLIFQKLSLLFFTAHEDFSPMFTAPNPTTKPHRHDSSDFPGIQYVSYCYAAIMLRILPSNFQSSGSAKTLMPLPGAVKSTGGNKPYKDTLL